MTCNPRKRFEVFKKNLKKWRWHPVKRICYAKYSFFSDVAISTHPTVTCGNLLHLVLTDQENSYFKYTGYDEGYSKCF